MDTKVDANELIKELGNKISELTVQNTILEIQNGKLRQALEGVNIPQEAPAEEPVLNSEITE